MTREIGIDYLIANGTENDKEIIENGLKMFTYTTSRLDYGNLTQTQNEIWIQGDREDALILINEWNRKAYYQARKDFLYAYHLNP